MSVVAIDTVRVGIVVERSSSTWVPFEYRMFFCRQKDVPPNNCVAEWASDVISCMSGEVLPGVGKLRVGERKRFWVTLLLTGTRDYWGEYDDEYEVIKCRPA